MPRYDYQCNSCDHVFEVRQSFDSEPRADCPLCTGESRRKFQVVPIIYKGSGFYTTDYKKSGYSGTSGAKDEAKEEKESTSSSKPSKSATATESKKEETASHSH